MVQEWVVAKAVARAVVAREEVRVAAVRVAVALVADVLVGRGRTATAATLAEQWEAARRAVGVGTRLAAEAKLTAHPNCQSPRSNRRCRCPLQHHLMWLGLTARASDETVTA